MNIHRYRPIFHRFGIAAALVSCGLTAACMPEHPPVAIGAAGDHVFKARVAQAYPPGTRGVVLRAELIREGFTIYDDRALRQHSAVFRAENLPCFSSVRIDWAEDHRGRITMLQAQRADCT